MKYVITFTLLVVGLQSAADDSRLLESAFFEDRALQELAALYERMTARQESSGVFREPEIGLIREAVDEVGDVRQDHMSNIIQQLQYEAAISNTVVRGLYEDTAVQLDVLYRRLTTSLEQDMTRRDASNEQRELMEELQTLQEALQEETMQAAEALQPLAELAERQEQLAETLNAEQPEIAEQMQEAAQDIQEVNLPSALEMQENILAQMEADEAMAHTQPMPEAMEQNAMPDAVIDQLEAMANQLEQSQDSPMAMEARQDMAMEMNQAAQQLPEIAEPMMQAMVDLMAEQDQAAQEQVKAAIEIAEEKREQQMEMAQQQPEPSEGSEPGPPQPGEGEMQNEAEPEEPGAPSTMPSEQDGLGPTLQLGAVGAGADGQDWTARLPERQREALLTAREARHAEGLEESVRRYFVHLAREQEP